MEHLLARWALASRWRACTWRWTRRRCGSRTLDGGWHGPCRGRGGGARRTWSDLAVEVDHTLRSVGEQRLVPSWMHVEAREPG